MKGRRGVPDRQRSLFHLNNIPFHIATNINSCQILFLENLPYAKGKRQMASSLLFITFKRKNYDKATLCQLSDILYYAAENEHLVDNIKQHPNAFTEKKVEVFPSVFRRFVQTNHCQTPYLSMTGNFLNSQTNSSNFLNSQTISLLTTTSI